MKKIQFKTDGLTGDMLKFVEMLNGKFAELPDGLSKEDIQKELKAMFKGLLAENGEVNVKFLEDIAELKGELDETKEGTIKAILKAQGDLITELKGKLNTSTAGKSLEELLAEKVDEFKKIVRSKQGQVVLDVKVAAVTTIAGGVSVANNISAATGLRLGDGPIMEIQRGTPFILDFVNVGSTTSPVLIWWDEIPKLGDFEITAEGVSKPLQQYKFKRESSDYKKASGYTVLSDEFMNDLPGLVTAIKRLMQIDCRNDMNDQILADIIATVPAYVYTDLDDQIEDPDDYAAIGAAICQIQALYFNPNVLVLNPADKWRLRLQKDDNGRYQMDPIQFNGQKYEFGNIVIDPRVAVGNFIVADGIMFNVDFKGDMQIRIGLNGTDLIQGQQTVVVDQFFYDYISTNRKGAFCYGNFDTIKQAIDAAQV